MNPQGTLPLDSIIGRDREVAAVDRLLDEARLVTVTGLGGVGKTRLAREVMAGRADGTVVVFVDLTTILRPDLVPERLAQALDLDESASSTPLEASLQALAERRHLLVLDSFEHVLGAAGLVRDLLAAAPDLSILVTSRLALRIAGEWEYPLGPLELPASNDWETVRHSPAGRLFIREAERIGSVLEANDASSVATICAGLGGMPLGLQLAAARTRLFSPEVLADRLANAMPTLPHAAGSSDALSSIIDWTVALLDEPDQERFFALGLLPGQFTLSAVTALWSGDDALDLLDTLLQFGLVRRSEHQDQFDLLAPVREYARRSLHDHSGEPEAMARLSQWALDFSAQLGRGLRGGDQVAAIALIRTEMSTLRMVIDWETAVDPPTAARIVIGLDAYWMRTALRDGMDVAGTLLGRPRIDEIHSARLLEIIATAERALVGPEPSIEHAMMMLDIAARRGDRVIEMRARFVLGLAYTGQAAIAELRRAADLAGELGDLSEKMHILGNLGVAQQDAGELEAALATLTGATAVARQVEDHFALAMNLANMAEGLLINGRLDDAETAVNEAAAILAAVGPQRYTSFAIAIAAVIAARRGHMAIAVDRLAEAAAVAEAMGGWDDRATIFDYAALVRLAGGRPRDAATLLGAADALRSPDADSSEPIRSPIGRIAAADIQTGLGARAAAAIDGGRARDPISLLAGLSAPAESGVVQGMHGRLSPREIEVLRLVADGATDRDIAAGLYISPKTASVHVSNLRAKLGVESRVELALEGQRLLDPPGSGG